MLLLESSISRLILAVLTVGVAIHAMREQSELYFGILIALAGGWVILAVGEVVLRARTARRGFWIAFLVVAVGYLFYGFGPWSDARMRGEVYDHVPKPSEFGRRHLAPSEWYLRLRRWIGIVHRAEIIIPTQTAEGNEVLRVEISESPTRFGYSELLLQSIELGVGEIVSFHHSRRTVLSAGGMTIIASYRIYLDACYMLTSLLLGWTAGFFAALTAYVVCATRWKVNSPAASPRSAPGG